MKEKINWGLCAWCKKPVITKEVPEMIPNGDAIHRKCFWEYKGGQEEPLTDTEIKRLRKLLKQFPKV